MKKLIIGLSLLAVLLCFGAAAYASTSSGIDVANQISYNQKISGSEYKSPLNTDNEQRVDVRSQSLIINNTDISLPGKNGMDLSITRAYKSASDNIIEISLPNGSEGFKSKQYAYKYNYIYRSTNYSCYIIFGGEEDMFNNNAEVKIDNVSTTSGGKPSSRSDMTVNGSDAYYFSRLTFNDNYGITLTRDTSVAAVELDVDVESSIVNCDIFSDLKEKDKICDGWYLRLPYFRIYNETRDDQYLEDNNSVTIDGNTYSGLSYTIQDCLFSNENGQLIWCEYRRYYIKRFEKEMIEDPDSGRGVWIEKPVYDYVGTLLWINNSYATIGGVTTGYGGTVDGIDYSFYFIDKGTGYGYYFYNGRLVIKEDKYGNKIKYYYNSDNRLSSITDTCGRTVNFTWGANGYDLDIGYGNRHVKYKSEIDFGESILERDDKYTMTYINEANEATVYTSTRRGCVNRGERTAKNVTYYDRVNYITNIKYPSGGQKVFDYEKREKESSSMAVVEEKSRTGGEDKDVIIYEGEYELTADETNDLNLSSYRSYDGKSENDKFTRVTTQSNADDGSKNTNLYYYRDGSLKAVLSYDGKGNVNRKFSYYSKKDGYDIISEETTVQYNKNNASDVVTKTDTYDYEQPYNNLTYSYDGRVTVRNKYDEKAANPAIYPRYLVEKDQRVMDGTDSEYPYIHRVEMYKHESYASGNEQFEATDPSYLLVWENEEKADGTIKGGAGTLKERIEYEYDSCGRVTKVKKLETPHTGARNENSPGDVTTYSYEDTGYGTDVSALKTVTESKTLPDGTVASVVTKYDYYGNKVSVSGYGTDSVTYTYDAKNRVTREQYADGTAKTYSYTVTPAACKTEVTDQSGKKIRIVYDDIGRQIKTLVNPGEPSETAVEEINYNNLGQISKKTLDSGDNSCYNVEYKYNCFGEVIEEKATDNTGKVYRQNNYDYSFGEAEGKMCRVTTTTSKIKNEHNRVVTKYTDAWGLLVKATAKGGNDEYSVKNTYDSCGVLKSSTDANGNVTSFGYDYNSRQISETNAAGKTKGCTYNIYGYMTTSTDFMGNVTNYSYDNLGRVTETIAPMSDSENMKTQTFYNAAGDKAKDRVYTSASEFRDTDYTYDNRHRVTTVTSDGASYTKYFYDSLGNVSKTVTGMTAADLDAGESEYSDSCAVTSYTYAPYINSVSSVTNPDGTTHNYSYNYLGMLTDESWTKNGNTSGEISYNYDGFGQLVSKTAGNKAETFRYDLLGNVVESNGENGKTNYSYDDFGRLKTEKTDSGIVKKYTYDYNNNRTSFKVYTNYSDLQQDLSYVYDNLNRITSIKEGNSTVASYTYNDNGNLLSENNVAVKNDFVYNRAGMVLSKTVKNSAGTELKNYTYTYNLDGNVASYNGLNYTYDNNNRLSAVAEGTSNKGYTFDNRGNRLSLNETGADVSDTVNYVYDTNNRILEKTFENEKESFAYDFRGNLYLKTISKVSDTEETTRDVTAMGDSVIYEYDGFNRLTDVSEGINKAEYEYNSSGLRTSKTVNGEKTDFILDGIYVIAEIKDGDVTNYIRGVTGIIYSKDKKGTKTYYVTNNHGDVTALVNSSGNIIKEYTYDEYGVEKNPDKSDKNPFRYCGEYFDSETGFIYLRARYYDPELGRFISLDFHWTPDNMIYGDDNDNGNAEIDILAIRQSNNLYVYCMNSPIYFTDPSGYRSKEEADKIIRDNSQNIKDAASKFGVNPAILAATIYAEQRLNVDWKDDITDSIGGFYGINTSIGVAQVRVSTAKFLEDQGYMTKTKAEDGGWNIPGIGFVNGTETMARSKKLEEPAMCILYAAAYLKYFQDTWKSSYSEIDGRTAILATLYNLGHEKTKPNSNPQPNKFGNFAKESYSNMKNLLGLD